jgi:hypothetical protein
VEWPDTDADTPLMKQMTCPVYLPFSCSRIVSVAYRHDIKLKVTVNKTLSEDFSLGR